MPLGYLNIDIQAILRLVRDSWEEHGFSKSEELADLLVSLLERRCDEFLLWAFRAYCVASVTPGSLAVWREGFSRRPAVAKGMPRKESTPFRRLAETLKVA